MRTHLYHRKYLFILFSTRSRYFISPFSLSSRSSIPAITKTYTSTHPLFRNTNVKLARHYKPRDDIWEDPYQVLGLPRFPPPSMSEVKKAHRTLAAACHPDKVPPDAPQSEKEAAMRRMSALNVALQRIQNGETQPPPDKRHLYRLNEKGHWVLRTGESRRGTPTSGRTWGAGQRQEHPSPGTATGAGAGPEAELHAWATFLFSRKQKMSQQEENIVVRALFLLFAFSFLSIVGGVMWRNQIMSRRRAELQQELKQIHQLDQFGHNSPIPTTNIVSKPSSDSSIFFSPTNHHPGDSKVIYSPGAIIEIQEQNSR